MWTTRHPFEDIRYETTDDGAIAKITINRPEVRNAFRPKTVMELLRRVAVQPDRGVIVVTHDSRVYEFGDRIVSMSDGRIEQVQVGRN